MLGPLSLVLASCALIGYDPLPSHSTSGPTDGTDGSDGGSRLDGGETANLHYGDDAGSAWCVADGLVTCIDDDGCCPSACAAATDNDCSPVCGNGILEEGEECDSLSLPTRACAANCRKSCVWVIEYATGSQITIEESPYGDSDYDQVINGRLIMQFTDDNGRPGDGPIGILYSVNPADVLTTVLGTTIQSSETVTGGTATNTCPLATGTLLNGEVTWDACRYISDDWGTTEFDPTDQQVPDGQDDGCLTLHAVGNIQCDGGLLASTVCRNAGLSVGENPQDNIWDQPMGRTLVSLSSDTSSVTFGGSNYSGSPVYPDSRDDPAPRIADSKTESPTNTTARLWRSVWTISEVSRTCVPPPTSCP